MASQNGELGGYGKFAIGDYASFTGIGKTADQTKRRTGRPSFWRRTNGPIEILASRTRWCCYGVLAGWRNRANGGWLKTSPAV